MKKTVIKRLAMLLVCSLIIGLMPVGNLHIQVSRAETEWAAPTVEPTETPAEPVRQGEWYPVSQGEYCFIEYENDVWSSNNKNQSGTTATTNWEITLERDVNVYEIPWTVSSEKNYDTFTILLDGTEILSERSGEGSGTLSVTLAAGVHTLTARYKKDGSVDQGNDTATITLNPIDSSGVANDLAGPSTDENGTVTWDCIYFGNYWQEDTNGDGTADKNDAKTPIKWRVLSVDGDDAFLLADQNLDVQRYNDTDTDVTWETCTVRSWLNGYGDSQNVCGTDYSSDNFLDNAFTAREQAAIETTSVVNDDNPNYRTEGGNDTSDKVYLLSIREVTNPEYGFTSSINSTETREAVNTAYAASGTDTWWLRSPGYWRDNASGVNIDGYVDTLGFNVDNPYFVVRPALHLNLSSATGWSYAGSVASDGTTTTPIVIPTPTPDPAPATTAPSYEQEYTVRQSTGGLGSGSYDSWVSPESEGIAYTVGSFVELSAAESISVNGVNWTFYKWAINCQTGIEMEDSYYPHTGFCMPEGNVTATAVYLPPDEGSEETSAPAPTQTPDTGSSQSPAPQVTLSPVSPGVSSGTNPLTSTVDSMDNTDSSTEPDDDTEEVVVTEERTLTGKVITISGIQYKILKSTAKEKTVALYRAKNKKITSLSVPKTITYKSVSYKVVEISKNALKGCKKLKKVSIGNGVLKIGNNAFWGCISCTTITVGNKVQSIGSGAFRNCRKMKKITIRSKVLKKIGKNAFSGLSRKAAIRVPKSKVAQYRKLMK